MEFLNGSMMGIVLFSATILFIAALAVVSAVFRILTPFSSLIAALIGAALFVLGGIPYMGMMIFFVTVGAVVTRYHMVEKKERKVSEGRGGMRGIENVLAHAIIPLAFVVFLFLDPGFPRVAVLVPLAFTASAAFGAADTFASEIGVLSDKAFDIVTRQRVTPGTNGGVSALGEAAGLVGSLLMSLFGGLMFLVCGFPLGLPIMAWLVGCAALGWVGCQVDSLLGSTLERRELIGKSSVNFISMLVTGILASLSVGVLVLTGVIS
jgi:uncharacterized protein (TIGR00297 family)